MLACLGIDFEVVVSGFDEESLVHGRAETLATRLAEAKAMEVAAKLEGAIVLGADTIVVHDGQMLGKPADADEARSMLQRLRGRIHQVVTGVALVTPERVRAVHVVSEVRMRAYTDGEIEDTIARGVPFDKAGGYGIQDPVLRPVEACEGCFCSVMGLPLWTVARLLEDAGLQVDTSGLPERCATCPAREGPIEGP